MCKKNLIKLLCGKYEEFALYCLFGCLTFIIDTGTFFVLSRIFELENSSIFLHVCSIFSTLLAVTFAYITNRKYVFKSKVNDVKGILKELFAFYFARMVTLVFAEGFLEITVILLGFYDWLMKLTVNIIVIILNYIFSKFWIFNKK